MVTLSINWPPARVYSAGGDSGRRQL